jgi:hypothetical protein
VSAAQVVPLGNVAPHRLVVFKQVSPATQSPSFVQVVRHDGLVVSHTNGLQPLVAAIRQAPWPSQLAGKLSVDPIQLWARQPVAADQGRHAPAPSQVPSFEQSPADAALATQRPFGSEPPAATGRHKPTLPGTLQLRHRPVAPGASLQAELQQTPSVQNPLPHWLPALHAAPAGLRPHDPVASQVLGATQSASLAHEVRQAPAAHMNGKQGRLAGVTHVPFPSHSDAGVNVEVLGQDGSTHFTPLGQLAHAPAWHLPVVMQVLTGLAAHISCGSGAPPVTPVQIPALPGRLQAVQAPLQSLLQQTPCAQKPDRHSPAPAQAAPAGLRPQVPLRQTLPVMQSPSFVQADRHFDPSHRNGLHVRAGGFTHWPWLLQVGAGV